MKRKGYINTCINQIGSLQSSLPFGQKFSPQRMHRVHQIGLMMHPHQPLGQALYTLHALGVPIELLFYASRLIKIFLYKRNRFPNVRVFTDLYSTFSIPKKNGSERQICSPVFHLKELQRSLLPALNFAYEFPLPTLDSHGFRQGYSNVTAANRHIGTECVVKMDIKDFFSSFTAHHVKVSLDRFANNLEIDLGWLTKAFLIQILTFNDVLPTGAPTSPVLSNMYFKNFDARIRYLADRNNLQYSRYADDITISGSAQKAPKMIKAVKDELMYRGGFQLNEEKLNIQRKGRRQIVCGVIVNDKTSLGRSHKKCLRAALHRHSKGLTPFLKGKALTEAQLKGHLAYIRSVYDHLSEG